MESKDNIQHKDIFGEVIKNKLENYQMPLDKDIWEGIEKRITPKKQRFISGWYWLTGGVAALLGLVLLLHPLRKNENYLTQKTDIKIQNEQHQLIIQPRHEETFTVEKRLSTKQAVEKLISQNKQNKQHNSAEKTRGEQNKYNPIETENSVDIQSSTEFQAKEVKVGTANSDLQHRDSIPAQKTDPKITSLPEMPEILEETEDKPQKKHNKWLIAANVGTSGNLAFGTLEDGLYANEPSANNVYGKKMNAVAMNADAYMIDPEDFTNLQHFPPLSFGFAVQKNITKSLGISSGLVYTYLHSNYSLDNRWQQANASMELHYLGIPLNINILIADKKHWNYYFSIGGTIEKGLGSVYKQTIQNSDGSTTHQTNVYSKIDGIQTSVNAAFGIGYKLQKNWTLFFEPKIIYYFDNNQPISARTDTPLNVGFNGGLKIGF
ncbi:MAG: outer membrane beta-barrel protein [Paludibacteraceae bacterium]